MKRVKYFFIVPAVIIVILSIPVFVFLNSKLPQRDGELKITGLKDRVEVSFDTWGIPHINAQNETDAYRALGYLHAQDRLFQMELLRRLAKGELAEILGKKLVTTDKFFRTLGIKSYSREYVKNLNRNTQSIRVSEAYIDGINQFIANGAAPIEFSILGIQKKPFTLEDSMCIGGYLSYGFATAFKEDPLLSFVKENLGREYTEDLAYEREIIPAGYIKKKTAADTRSMADVALLLMEIENSTAPMGLFEGSNAWVITGKKTRSGKPILASDPHVEYGVPAVWYEAHISTPEFESYGHYFAGVPIALLGHNRKTGWGITMFKNDDIDFFREKINPANPDQVWNNGKWENMVVENETIKVKGEKDISIKVRWSKHGPIINDVIAGFEDNKEPVSMWWAYLEKSNRIFESFYEFGHAGTVKDFETAAAKLHAPGVNIMAADSSGNIGWWGAGKIPIRPRGTDSNFILESGKDEYTGFMDFKRHPQSINPARGYIISSNHRPEFSQGNFVPGYYNIPYRAERIEDLINTSKSDWTAEDMKAIQLDTVTSFHVKIRDIVVPIIESRKEIMSDKNAADALAIFKKWHGEHNMDSIGPTIFFQFYYDLMEEIFKDEMGDKYFPMFLAAKTYEKTISVIVAKPLSPWWDNKNTSIKETREDIISKAWLKCVRILEKNPGGDPEDWRWDKVHSLEFMHPIGKKKPFNLIFNVGPFHLNGAREVINNIGFKISGGYHYADYGPSTRRIIDFGDIENSFGINPLGQSGYFMDSHYSDQSGMYSEGKYRKQLFNRQDIKNNTKSTLVLVP